MPDFNLKVRRLEFQRKVHLLVILTVLSLDAVTKISFSCAQAQSQMMRAWALSALIVLYPSVMRVLVPHQS